jgi:hypothetical protein
MPPNFFSKHFQIISFLLCFCPSLYANIHLSSLDSTTILPFTPLTQLKDSINFVNRPGISNQIPVCTLVTLEGISDATENLKILICLLMIPKDVVTYALRTESLSSAQEF